MDNFLFELAMMKYQMYHSLYKFKPSAYTENECFDRIQLSSKYSQLLTVIDYLPIKEKQQFNQIEQEHFSDAPYVHGGDRN